VDLEAVKQRLSPRLLGIAGVSGVGVSGGQLTIYLEKDSDTARQQIDQLLAGEAPDTPTRFVVTGEFEAR
jgi:hypothetical protein